MGIGDHKKLIILACRFHWDKKNCCWITVNRVILKKTRRFLIFLNRDAIFKNPSIKIVQYLYRGIFIKLKKMKRRFCGYLRHGQMPAIERVLVIVRMDFFVSWNSFFLTLFSVSYLKMQDGLHEVLADVQDLHVSKLLADGKDLLASEWLVIWWIII